MAFGANLSPDFNWDAVKSYVEFTQVVQERFPSWAWALDDPELGPLLREAASAEEWSPTVFESKLKATDWWNQRTASQREWDVFIHTAGEAEVQARIDEAANQLRTQASALGVTIGDDDAVTAMATQMLRDGWSGAEVTANLVALDPNKPGDLAAAKTMVNGVMSDYMVSVDEATAADFARKLVTGEMTSAGVTEYARNLARQRYPNRQITELLDQGVSLKEYFAPHRQLIAKSLGLNPADVDLTDPKFVPVMGIRDGDTVAPMTLEQTNRFVRTLDDYWRTAAGKAEKATMGRALLKQLGVIA